MKETTKKQSILKASEFCVKPGWGMILVIKFGLIVTIILSLMLDANNKVYRFRYVFIIKTKFTSNVKLSGRWDIAEDVPLIWLMLPNVSLL